LQNPQFRLSNTIELVKGKMRNQYRQLQRLATNRNLPKLSQMVAIHQLANQLGSIDEPGQAFGIEGMASAHYYEALGQFFPNDLPFDKRSRRPPKDPANALLSYIYTLLSMETAAHLWATGLDPAWGLYHATADNRYALALDMVEPIRPILDGIALDLINHKRLKAEDFTQDEEGFYLSQSARPILYQHLEKSLEREYNSRQLGHTTTLRKHLRHQCLTLRKAITGESAFEPLRSN
jgi:CRISPR-associated protein Cas1